MPLVTREGYDFGKLTAMLRGKASGYLWLRGSCLQVLGCCKRSGRCRGVRRQVSSAFANGAALDSSRNTRV